MRYEIHVEGILDQRWSNWFGGMTITSQPGGETVITGPVADEAALHGLLTKIRDLNLPLISTPVANLTDAPPLPPVATGRPWPAAEDSTAHDTFG